MDIQKLLQDLCIIRAEMDSDPETASGYLDETIRELSLNRKRGTMKHERDRFCYLNPQEKDALRVLIQNHLNTISEISLHKEFRVIGYLDWLAELEEELIRSEQGED